MNTALWSAPMLIVVLALGVVALRLVARKLRKRRALPTAMREELAELPMSPLQQRAWIALVSVVLIFAACFAIITGAGGAAVYWDDDSVRLPVTGLFLGAMLLHFAVVYLPLASARQRGRYDERDRRIIEAAPAFQSAAMLIAMAIWVIYLTETSRPERMIPTVYLYLMMGSLFFVNMAATDLGILFGYWSGVGDVED